MVQYFGFYANSQYMAVKDSPYILNIILIKLKFHLARLDSTRLDTFDFFEPVEQVDRDERVERDEPCSSNMADDERSCTTLVVFKLLHTQILFVSPDKIN